MAAMKRKIDYFLWAAKRAGTSTDCPGCCGKDTILIRRKHWVTALYECNSCGLRYRTPKDEPEVAKEFYQESYSQGFTTDCPSDEELARLKAKKFEGLERDYRPFIKVLNAVGLKPGDSLLEFGCSWGYGSWQLREVAGLKVFSYEIGVPRATYAKEKMGLTMVESFDNLPEKVDCLYTSHVIEHLPDPNAIWEAAKKALRPGGMLVCFCPNGNAEMEWTGYYDQLWGQVHPLMLTTKFFHYACAKHGFQGEVYTKPYDLEKISQGQSYKPANPDDELCLVARLK